MHWFFISNTDEKQRLMMKKQGKRKNIIQNTNIEKYFASFISG